MKHIKILLIAAICMLGAACDKDRLPVAENTAYAQFERAAGVVTATPATNMTFSRANLSKATPAATDASTLKIIGAELVSSVKVMVDYQKGTTVLTAQYKETTTFPLSITTSLTELTALFASQGVTATSVAANDRFTLRTVITMKTGTIVSEQTATLNLLPYLTTLVYTVVN